MFLLRLTICFVFTLQFLANAGYGQQSEQYSLYFMDPYISNPAYGGLDGSLSLTAGIRQQWTDLPGKPASQLVQGHIPLYQLQGAGGVQFMNEQIGNGSITHFSLSYNYVRESGEWLVSGGLSAGASVRRFDGASWRTPGGNYTGGGIDHQDPELFNDAVRGTSPFLAAGIYAVWRSLEGGVAMRQVLSPGTSLDPLGSFGFENWWQAQFLYDWDFSGNLSFRPSFQIKTDGKQWQSDLSILLSYNGRLFGGMSVRGFSSSTINALVLVGGVQLNEHYQLAYAFDHTIGPLQGVAGGSHELMLRYNLNRRIGGGGLPAIIYNPRFL